METHMHNLVVRNTFLQYSSEREEDDGVSLVRSSSAPPSCRHAKGKGEHDPTAASTVCESLEPDTSTVVTDSDDAVSLSSEIGEHEGASAPISPRRWNDIPIEDSDDETDIKPNLTSEPCQLAPTSPQEQLDQMSQMVMDIWSKLRVVEASVEAQSPNDVAEVVATATEIKSPVETNRPVSTPVETNRPGRVTTCQKLVANARPFVPSELKETFQSVLTKVGEVLTSTQGVANVDVKVGPVGTLATIEVYLAMGAFPPAVIADAKSAFLNVAAGSKSTYVLGYEANPFQDDAAHPGFFTALASLPAAWECSACWDTYTYGVCQRNKVCVWHHPGRNELQPVRVVLR